MDTRIATVRGRIDAAHKLTGPLTSTLSDAREELDEAIGVLADDVGAAESYVEDLELMADTAADRATLRAARTHLEALEELQGQLERLHAAIDQAHTSVEEAEGLHEEVVESLDEITPQ